MTQADSRKKIAGAALVVILEKVALFMVTVQFHTSHRRKLPVDLMVLLEISRLFRVTIELFEKNIISPADMSRLEMEQLVMVSIESKLKIIRPAED